MKVALEKSYPMPASTEVVWAFLQSIENVAQCMPGARITERLDATHFKGTVSVKVGPASMAFKGTIEVMGLDEAQRSLRLVGKGSDSSGTSGATLDLTARVEPGATADSSNLIGQSEVSMSGKAAAFGGRMMGTVADQVLNQFAGNFAKQVSALAAHIASTPATAVATSAATAHAASGAEGPTPCASDTASASVVPLTTATGPATPPQAAPQAYASALATALPDMPEEPANQINALALVWAIIRDWFRGLFRRKPA
jgi:uncharacterized protein